MLQSTTNPTSILSNQIKAATVSPRWSSNLDYVDKNLISSCYTRYTLVSLTNCKDLFSLKRNKPLRWTIHDNSANESHDLNDRSPLYLPIYPENKEVTHNPNLPGKHGKLIHPQLILGHCTSILHHSMLPAPSRLS